MIQQRGFPLRKSPCCYLPIFAAVEHVLRCNVRAVAPDLEVAVVAAGTSGAAHIADELTLLDRLTGVHHQRQAVGVQGGVAVAVADDDGVAVAVACTGAVIAGLGHRTACRSIDRRTGGGADIYALVAAAVPAGAVPIAGHRPDKLSSAGDIGCTGGHLFGAHRNFFSHRLLGHHSAQNLLGKLIAVCIVHPLCRHGADAVLTLLGNTLGTGVQLVGFGGLGGVGDLFLPAFHLGDAHLQHFLLPHHGQCIAGQDLGILCFRRWR